MITMTPTEAFDWCAALEPGDEVTVSADLLDTYVDRTGMVMQVSTHRAIEALPVVEVCFYLPALDRVQWVSVEQPEAVEP